MMEDVLAEVRSDLFCLLETSVHLLGLIERVIAPERLSFTFGILLQEEGRSGYLVDGATTTHPYCH